jgi:hypothetical protein
MTSPFRAVFPSRLARASYFVRLVICVGVVVLFYYSRGLTDAAANAVMLLIWNYVAFFVILPRARECGMSFMYAILALVPLIFPFLAVALIFRPSEYRFSNVSEEATLKT